MAFLNNPRWVAYTPFVTALLLDGGAIGQIVRMIREQTAAGQSLISWCSVVAALVLWLNYYRIFLPNERITFWVTAGSIVINTGIIATIVYFRFLLG